MKRIDFSLQRFLKSLLFGIAPLAFSACLSDSPGKSSKESGDKGHVRISVGLAPQARTLAKSAAGADTVFHLDSILVRLSANGATPRAFAYAITGRPDTGTISVELPAYVLDPLRTWKAVFLTIDETPGRRDTVHRDSVFFNVQSAETTYVAKTLASVYSLLSVRLISNNADSIRSGLAYMRLRLNGATLDSVAVRGGVFRAVHFASAAQAWAVDDSGRAFRSLDSGITWYPRATGAATRLRSVWFLNTMTGWVAGDGGAIRKTTDGGATWTAQTSGTAQSLARIQFLNANVGYAGGGAGIIVRSVDGGANWHVYSGGWLPLVSGVAGSLNAIDLASGAVGTVVGDGGVIRRTTNGGFTWSTQTSGVPQNLRAVSYVDGNEGYAAGDAGSILYTANAGAAWTATSGGSAQLNGIQLARSAIGLLCPLICSNNVTGLAVGNGGTILRSTNGTSWSASGVTSGTTESLNAVALFDPSGISRAFRAYVVGNAGVIRTSTNDGTTWAAQTSGTLNALTALSCPTSAVCWAAGAGGTVLKTTNSGANWNPQTSGTTADLYAVEFLDANLGYAAGAGGVIRKTVDGGATWTAQASATTEALRAIYAGDADTALAAGANGTLRKTRSAGIVYSASTLNSIYFTHPDTGYAVGPGGVALRTRNGARTWQTLASGTAQNLNVVYSTGNYAYVGGDNGTILTIPHNDAGTAYTPQTSNTSRALRGIWVRGNLAQIYFVGDSGAMVTATNSQGPYTAQTQGTESLHGIHFFGTSNVGVAVGSNESALRTLDGATWTQTQRGPKLFEARLTHKYLRPGQTYTVLLQAIDRESPLRGYEASQTFQAVSGQDAQIGLALTRCGHGGSTPACTP